MPQKHSLTTIRSQSGSATSRRVRLRTGAGMLALFSLFVAPAISAEPPLPVSSREVELHYKLERFKPGSLVDLWYTRDRGASWQHWGADDDGKSPIVFVAPAEGLYGLFLAVREPGTGSTKPPAAFQRPDRWVFVDYTPPLAQWDSVEPGENFAVDRLLHLRWTAHDDNFPNRPISLSYRIDGQQKWADIETELPNLGRYDWKAPPEVAGQVSFKLVANDQGGQTVERVFGPMTIQALAPATQPAKPAVVEPAATQPAAASQPSDSDSVARRQRAEELYRQGSSHLIRGQYALAAERFREAIEANPDALPAINDLAGIYYLQKDYDKAAELYNRVLARDARHVAALRGLALVRVAQKQYALSRDALRRLVSTNEKDAEAWLDLGDVLFMMGQQSDARNHWRQASRVDPAAQAIIDKARRRMEMYGTEPAAAPAAYSSR